MIETSFSLAGLNGQSVIFLITQAVALAEVSTTYEFCSINMHPAVVISSVGFNVVTLA